VLLIIVCDKVLLTISVCVTLGIRFEFFSLDGRYVMALALGPLGGYSGAGKREGTGEGDGEGAVREELSEGDGTDGETIRVAKIEETEGGGEGGGDYVRSDTPNAPSLPAPSPPIYCEIKPLRSLFAPVPGRLFDRTFPFRSHSKGCTIDVDAMYEEIKAASRGMELNENCEKCDILCSIL
jgi:hypothetical protein